MEYADPHHKRTEFSAESFSFDSEGEDASIRFVGGGQHESITLRTRSAAVIAIVPEAECEFVITKVQILEQLQWLTFDFRENPLLHRIVIHTDRLDIGHLDFAMKSLIGMRLPLYHRLENREPIQPPSQRAPALRVGARGSAKSLGNSMKLLRKGVLVIGFTSLVYFTLGALLFRMPIGRRVTFEGEVMWKMLDFGDGTLRYWSWEVWPWGTESLSLVDGEVYRISEDDDRRIWSEPWMVLEKDRRTKRVILSAYPVLVGGFGRARVERIIDVQGQPYVIK